MELMRGIAFLALLFAGAALGAETRQAETCGDGTTHQSGYCPAVLSSASCSQTGATTGSCSATSDESDGTRYVCATSTNSALTGVQIESCSGGAAIAGSSAAETGSNSIGLTGLTTDAEHYGQIVNESPEGWYSNRLVSGGFTPVEAGATNASRIDSALSGISTVAFSYQYPADPITTNTMTVSNSTDFNTYAQQDGYEITVNAGSYSDITVTGSDVDIIMNDSVFISGDFTVGQNSGSGPSRIRITGGNVQGELSRLIINRSNDLMFDDFVAEVDSNFDRTRVSGFDPGGGSSINRVAFINSSLGSKDNGLGDSFAIFYNAASGRSYSDHIYANMRFYGDEQSGGTQGVHTTRFQAITNFILYDSWVNAPQDNGSVQSTGLRIHRDTTNGHIEDTHTVGNLLLNVQDGSAIDGDCYDCEFINVTRYDDVRFFATTQDSLSTGSTVTNSRMYTTVPVTNGENMQSYGFLTDGGSNQLWNWDGSTFPQADRNGVTPTISAYGAQR